MLSSFSSAWHGNGSRYLTIQLSLREPDLHNQLQVVLHVYFILVTRLFVDVYFHYDAGRQGIEIYTCIKFHLLQCFSLSVYTYMSPL